MGGGGLVEGVFCKGGEGFWGGTYGRCCCRIRRLLPVRRICTFRTRNLRRKRRNGSGAAKRPFCSGGRRRGFGRGWGAGSFVSRRV